MTDLWPISGLALRAIGRDDDGVPETLICFYGHLHVAEFHRVGPMVRMMTLGDLYPDGVWPHAMARNEDELSVFDEIPPRLGTRKLLWPDLRSRI